MYLLILNKPSGIVVHPGAGHKTNTLSNGLLYKNKNLIHVPRTGIVHRLDKNTTGLMLVAKSLFTYYKLINLIKLRKVTRIYETLVLGKIQYNGTIINPISRHKKNRKIMTINPTGKKAITHFTVIENFLNCTHLKIRLETGRTHQIRVHMLHIKHPILGDSTYYNKESKKLSISIFKKLKNEIIRPMLHAKLIKLNHPIYKTIKKCEIDLPKDMKKIIEFLKKQKEKK